MLGAVLIMSATVFKWIGNSRIPEIFQSMQQFAKYPVTVYLEHMEINKDLSVKKVYSGTTSRNESEVEDFYHQAFEAVNDLHNATVNFFGDEIFK